MNNYEKKYKETLGTARYWHSNSKGDIPAVLEEIFPELKESEDERIRGAIMHFISHTPTVPKGIINKKQMLAWLEKQGKRDVRYENLEELLEADTNYISNGNE